MVFNDMINVNIRGADETRTKQIAESGLVDASMKWVAFLRSIGTPIIWIRVERRQDRKDRKNVITTASLRGPAAHPPVVKGSFESRNVDELPIRPEDHEVLKPRYSPFMNTDLDLQLRARGVDTILLGGISTNLGVESCARTAFDLDYNVVVIRDCCWASDPEVHRWSLEVNLPNFARVMTAEEAGALLR